jgi:hypothetical protein
LQAGVASAAYHRRYYRDHRASIVARRKLTDKAKRERLRAIVIAAKQVACAGCGNEHEHWIMQFDHVRGRKLGDIATLVGRRVSEARLKSEIEKCEVVCANCHADRTYKRRNGM